MAVEQCYEPAVVGACPGGEEAHLDHLTLNGECPWCGAYTDRTAREQELPPWGQQP